MEPFLKEGQVAWVNNWAYLFSRPKQGDIVLVEHQGRELIKRVAAVEQNQVFVVGDNQDDSFDSRKFGYVQTKTVLGKVVDKLVW